MGSHRSRRAVVSSHASCCSAARVLGSAAANAGNCRYFPHFSMIFPMFFFVENTNGT